MTLTNWVLLAGLLAGLLTSGCTAVTSSTTPGGFADASLKPDTLRLEYRAQPLGIGEKHPRFSWVLTPKDSATRGQVQTAYQILVSSTSSNPTGDLWDTGKVLSDATAQVVYSGKSLSSNQDCYWTVRVWDGAGQSSAWSPVQRFSTGLLEPSDWTAQWIGYDAPWQSATASDETASLASGNWIWFPEGNPIKDAPAAARYFRKSFTLPNKPIRQAILAVAADNNATAYIDTHKAVTATDFLSAHMNSIAARLTPGAENVLAIEAHNSGGPAGLTAKLTIEFESGEPMVISTDDTWKSSTKAASGWKTVAFDDAAWQSAKVIAQVGDAPWGIPAVSRLELPPVPFLRSTFTVNKPIKRAVAYASALGLYELRLNGSKVGHYELTPGWEDYRHRVYYNTYDLTNQIKQGKNALGVLLGDGWYDGYVGYTFKRHTYEGDPRAKIQINIEYADGTTQTVGTDDSWRAAYGPIREADLLMGCTYDATQDKNFKGWDTIVYDDSKWNKVAVGAVGPFADIPVEAYVGDPTIRHENLPAKKITIPSPGTYVFDLGQNMVGWAHFKLNGKQGQKITFRYSEMLNPDGTLYTTALRSARATDFYTPAADGQFEWEPHFTFHGFRYVEVTGVDEKPDLDAVTGVVIGADMPRTGFIETSNPLVNQLAHNIIWGQKGNYLEVPTDCPQRDERLGWTGDAQFFVRTGSYNYDVSAFFHKWLIDLVQDSQMANGGFTHVAPAIAPNDGGATAWQDASVICTYTMYKFYGDTRNIERQWPHLEKFMDYLHNTSKDYVRNDKPFGDWLNQGASAKSEVTGTAYYAYVAHLMSEMAAAIGKTDEAKQYGDLADKIRETWQKNYLQSDGSILESSQTGFALAFTMNLLPEDMKAAAAKQFVEEVKKKDWHLGTGFIGTPRLLPGLQKAGETAVAYRLLLQDTFPSWLYQVKLGATTMWERWDGYRPDKGFEDPAMNSFNHYAFGSVGEWMYASMVGIDQQDTSFKNILINPHPGGGFTFVKGRYDSINGPIVSNWTHDGRHFTLHVEIPVNTRAFVYVPGPSKVMESGKAADSAPGVTFIRQDGDAMVYQVGSGQYDFASTLPAEK